jgi:hypothetical protein
MLVLYFLLEQARTPTERLSDWVAGALSSSTYLRVNDCSANDFERCINTHAGTIWSR